MKNNKQILKIILFLSLISIVGIIIYIINKKGTIIDFKTSFLALIGSGIGFGISLLLKQVSLKTDRRKIFLSYSLHDKDFALKLSSDLKENNIVVFNEDEIIKPGDTLNQVIKNYIIGSDKIIVILSKTTYKSKFLKSEVELAKKNKKIIIPLLKEDVEIPNFLSSYKIADFRHEYDKSIKDLISSL